jgi:hypothetical protein
MRPPAFVTIVAFCTSLLGQQPNSGNGDATNQRRTEQRAQAMRDQIGSGRPIESHVRVAVRLKNGNVLRGVVKDGKLVERVDGLRFVDAHARDAGAGIRLWYSTGARNYVFLPFTDFASYEVLQRLTQKQLEDLERDLQQNEARAVDRQEQQRQRATGSAAGAVRDTPAPAASEATPPADGATVPPPLPVPAEPGEGAATESEGEAAADANGAGESGALEPAGRSGPAAATKPEPPARRPAKPKAKVGNTTAAKTSKEPVPPSASGAGSAGSQEQQRAWFALLQEYPPSAGWNQQKRDEIARRLIVVGAKPSAAEQRFVDQFREWEKACANFGVAAAAPGATPAGETRGRGRGNR